MGYWKSKIMGSLAKRSCLTAPIIFIILLICYCSILPLPGIAQNDSKGSTGDLKDIFKHAKDLANTQTRYQKIDGLINSKTARFLQSMQRKEAGLYAKLAKVDSVKAAHLFHHSSETYSALLEKLKKPATTVHASSIHTYLPKLDSLQNVFQFLSDKGVLSGQGILSPDAGNLRELAGRLKSLQQRLQSAGEVKQVIQEREKWLTDQFQKLAMGNQLKRINRQTNYYHQQMSEYQAMINDPSKIEQKLLSLARQTQVFRDFMAKNSLLASLFPSSSGTTSDVVVPGLQTRQDVAKAKNEKLPVVGNSPDQNLQQQVQQAESELKNLKDKINQMGGGTEDLTMPVYTPNHQKVKSFFKRMEYGFNIQSVRANGFLPATSDIALTMGYKLSDKSTVGMGMGYKLGWGKNISHLQLSSQGISLRGYLDIKLKGNLWISGGYEENYQHEFTKIEQLRNVNAWQKSGLIGLTKKYRIGKKTGNLQLLWDFLSYSQAVPTPAVKFRIGYQF